MNYLAILFASFATLALAASAQVDAPAPSEAETSEIELRARKIGNALRCVVCQNQPIGSSNAPLAADMRRLVNERLIAGDSDEEVMAYLVDRYGTFVLLKPPLQTNTLLLWFGPLLFILLAGFGWRLYARRSPLTTFLPEPLSPEEMKELDNLQNRGGPE